MLVSGVRPVTPESAVTYAPEVAPLGTHCRYRACPRLRPDPEQDGSDDISRAHRIPPPQRRRVRTARPWVCLAPGPVG